MATFPACAGANAFQLEIRALAGLAGAGGQMQRLSDRLVDGVGVQSQHGSDAGGHRRTQMRDVVDLVLVQAYSLDQVDLDLVRGRQAPDQIGTADTELLGDRNERRDVVAGVGVVGGQEGVVEIQFAHRDAVGPGRPFRRIAAASDAEDPGPLLRAMRQRLHAGHRDRAAQHRRGTDGGVVDDPVRHHLGGLRLDVHRVERRPRRSCWPSVHCAETPRHCAGPGPYEPTWSAHFIANSL